MHTLTKGTTLQTLLLHNLHAFSRRFAQESHANIVEMNVDYTTVVVRNSFQIYIPHLSSSTVKISHIILCGF